MSAQLRRRHGAFGQVDRITVWPRRTVRSGRDRSGRTARPRERPAQRRCASVPESSPIASSAPAMTPASSSPAITRGSTNAPGMSPARRSARALSAVPPGEHDAPPRAASPGTTPPSVGSGQCLVGQLAAWIPCRSAAAGRRGPGGPARQCRSGPAARDGYPTAAARSLGSIDRVQRRHRKTAA